ncbi:hypothetical protein BDZ91DRAFT_786739 [Kalaharituber pfeilii]|nr:hypothetical protein BDZ91DRAFT_786739 [Kalaharituber pfeilii]
MAEVIVFRCDIRDTESINHRATQECKEVIQSSLSEEASHTNLVPSNNGFIDAVLTAHAQHHHLEIRPDDVWITILTQFSMFVNANADNLADKFDCKLGNSDDGVEAVLPLLHGSVHVRVPSVTLHGEKSDWVALLGKIEKLKGYTIETTMWYHMLEPVLSRFARAFNEPDEEWNREFWSRVATTEKPDPRCGGPTYITGWVTAFMPFDNEGMWQPRSCVFPASTKKRSKGSNPTSSRSVDDSNYAHLTRAELMMKYNADAEAYYNQLQRQSEADQNITAGASNATIDHEVSSKVVIYDAYGIQALAIRAKRNQWVHGTGGGKPTIEQTEEWKDYQLIMDGTWYPRHYETGVTRAVVDVDVTFMENGRAMEAVWVTGLMGYYVRQIRKIGDSEEREKEQKEMDEEGESEGEEETKGKNSGVLEESASKGLFPGADLEKLDQEATFPFAEKHIVEVSSYESSLSPRVGWWMYEKNSTVEQAQALATGFPKNRKSARPDEDGINNTPVTNKRRGKKMCLTGSTVE